MKILNHKEIKFHWGVLLPVYILLWPFFSMFVQVDALSYYINTKYVFIDLRLVFYALALVACIFKLIFGNKIKKNQIILLVLLLSFNLFYLASFLMNLNDVIGDYKQFINGYFLFSILCAYSILHFHSINWELSAKLYALSLSIISIFGLYAFSRYTHFGIQVISGSYSEQLFRLSGSRTYFIPAVFIFAFIFFEFKYLKIKSIIIKISFFILNSLILISSQRNALIIVIYELIIFFLYYSPIQVTSFLILAFIVLLFFSKQIFLLIKLTLINKIISLEISTEESRLDIWKATINALVSDIRHIIFGVSEGGLPSVSGSNWPMVSSSNPHNMLLYFWQATGLAGLVLIICIIFLCAYLIHRKNKLHQIIFYWLFVISLVFVGFGFYDDVSRTDLLNIGIVVAFSLLLRKQDSKLPSRASTFNQDSSRFNESYS